MTILLTIFVTMFATATYDYIISDGRCEAALPTVLGFFGSIVVSAIMFGMWIARAA